MSNLEDNNDPSPSQEPQEPVFPRDRFEKGQKPIYQKKPVERKPFRPKDNVARPKKK